jgi:two-component system sensor histidine kinase/response regulator
LKMVLIWRLNFDPRERGALLVVNWLAVSIPALLISQLSGALAARLRTTNLHLRESERLRETLTDMVVHDLRNPLAALMAGLDILRLTLVKELSAEQMNLLDISRRSGHVLLGMVSELLDISKMEAEQLSLNIQPVDLPQLIADSIEAEESLADIEGLAISLHLSDEVNQAPCDRQLVSRVMANLLSNAIKHTPRGGKIAVTASLIENAVSVSVADTGDGIPIEDQQRIFEKFGQVERPGKERRGAGLGLTFCKMAVEAHGGQIWVESRGLPGEGSTFTFTLPLAQPAVKGSNRSIP